MLLIVRLTSYLYIYISIYTCIYIYPISMYNKDLFFSKRRFNEKCIITKNYRWGSVGVSVSFFKGISVFVTSRVAVECVRRAWARDGRARGSEEQLRGGARTPVEAVVRGGSEEKPRGGERTPMEAGPGRA